MLAEDNDKLYEHLKKRALQHSPQASAEMTEYVAKHSVELCKKLDELTITAGNDMLITIGSIMDVADSKVVDIISDLKKQGLYKHKLKHDINNYRRSYDVYKGAINVSIKDKESAELYLNTLDTIIDDVAPDLLKQKYAVKNALGKCYKSNHSVDIDILADLYVVLRLYYVAQDVYKRIINITKRDVRTIFGKEKIEVPKGLDNSMTAIFGKHNPAHVAGAWLKVANHFYEPIDEEVMDMVNNTPDVQNGDVIITRKLVNGDNIDKNIIKAKEMTA